MNCKFYLTNDNGAANSMHHGFQLLFVFHHSDVKIEQTLPAAGDRKVDRDDVKLFLSVHAFVWFVSQKRSKTSAMRQAKGQLVVNSLATTNRRSHHRHGKKPVQSLYK